MYGKVCYKHSIIIVLTRLISFELGRVIDENACKELLNQIPVKKIVQQAIRESNAEFKKKICVFCHLIKLLHMRRLEKLVLSHHLLPHLPGKS